MVTRGDVMSGAWTLHHYNHSIAAASITNTRLLLLTHGAGVQNSGDYVDPADPPRPLHLHTLQNSGKVIVKQEGKAYWIWAWAWAVGMFSGWSSTYSYLYSGLVTGGRLVHPWPCPWPWPPCSTTFRGSSVRPTRSRLGGSASKCHEHKSCVKL